MTLGSRSKKKTLSLSQARRRAAIDAIAGIAEAGFLAAAADGELADAELGALAEILDSLFDGQAQPDQIRELIEACAEEFARDGFQTRMDAIAEALPNDESRIAALYAVACVLMSDDEFDPDDEGSFYDDLAEQIGVDEEVAVEIWNETADVFGWS